MNLFHSDRYRLSIILIILALLFMASVSMAVSLSEANSVSTQAAAAEQKNEPARREVRRLNDISIAETDAPLFAQELIDQVDADARKRRVRHD